MQLNHPISTGSGELGLFHRVFRRYYLTMCAKEQHLHPEMSQEQLRDASIYHAVLLLGMPVLSLGVLGGALLAKAQFVPFPKLGVAGSNTLLAVGAGIALLIGLRLAVGRIVRRAAYSTEQASQFASSRDQWIASRIYWGAFVLSIGLPVAGIAYFKGGD